MSEQTIAPAELGEASFMRRHSRGIACATALSLALTGAFPIVASGMSRLNDGCVTPTEADFAAVDALIASSMEQAVLPAENEDVVHFNAQLAQGLRLDMHTVPNGYFPDYQTTSFSEYLEVSQAHLRNFGISITTSDESFDIAVEGRTVEVNPLSKEQLELDDTKLSIGVFVEQLSTVPAEFTNYSGLKNIRLVKIKNSYVGFVWGGDDTIYFDPTVAGFDFQVFGHELTHLADECDDIRDDAAFADLGPEGLYEDGDSTPTLTDVSSKLYKMKDFEQNGKFPKAQRLKQKVGEMLLKVATARDYGKTNPAEDKATIGQEILDNSIFSRTDMMQDNEMPVLHAKYRLLLARWFARVPEAVEYLILQHKYK